MGAAQAVGVAHRRELAAAEDPEDLRRRLADTYAVKHLSAAAAAAGHADDVILPAQTRDRLAWAMGAVRRDGRRDRVRNIPL